MFKKSGGTDSKVLGDRRSLKCVSVRRRASEGKNGSIRPVPSSILSVYGLEIERPSHADK
jgi:hypothetical protein